MGNQDLEITPKTKVGELLDEFPELEEVLIKLVPTFSKLKNPVLRRTIARITTLQQASLVGNIAIDKLINTLRKEVGQNIMDHSHPTHIENTEAPKWFSADKISVTFDARETIASGGHPLEAVFSRVSQIEDGQIFLLITPFMPAPLIDKVKAKGYLNWTKQEGTAFNNYFIKE